VAHLAEMRRRGVKRFDVAWSYTMSEHRPPLTWRRGAGGSERGKAPLDILRRECRRAWKAEDEPLRLGELYDRVP
jgi:hypothetical protein